MFAWYRAVRSWTAMRFDDHRGLVPAKMRLTAVGLRGTLVRTKTNGTGKRQEELYLHVDFGAYLKHSTWLRVGWELWGETDPNRDFFLGLPTPDLAGMRNIEARYPDAQAMSKALMCRCTQPDGSPIFFVAGSWNYWSEHSDRAFLTSVAACIPEVASDWLDNVGRWSSRQSLQYVRPHLKRIAHIQQLVESTVA